MGTEIEMYFILDNDNKKEEEKVDDHFLKDLIDYVTKFIKTYFTKNNLFKDLFVKKF